VNIFVKTDIITNLKQMHQMQPLKSNTGVRSNILSKKPTSGLKITCIFQANC